jgi:hypothetical protein
LSDDVGVDNGNSFVPSNGSNQNNNNEFGIFGDDVGPSVNSTNTNFLIDIDPIFSTSDQKPPNFFPIQQILNPKPTTTTTTITMTSTNANSKINTKPRDPFSDLFQSSTITANIYNNNDQHKNKPYYNEY